MATSSSRVQHDSLMAGKNISIICTNTSLSSPYSNNIWQNGNPLKHTTSLLLFQLSGISTVSILFNICLKPLGQSSLVSQIFGGMIFGPSFIGHNRQIADNLFPKTSSTVINIFAGFGIIFFLFVTGVKTDPVLMVRPGRKAAIIGSSALIVTSVSSIALALVLKKFLTMNANLENSLVLIALSQCLTGFPVISTLLSELNILNTDIGQLALASSMFCDLIGICMVAVLFSLKQSESGVVFGLLPSLVSIVAFVASNFLILRPRLVKMFDPTLGTKIVDEKSISFIFTLVLVASFLSEVIGQHYIFGPLILGLAVPEGPPLGAAISSRLDTLATTFFYPAYCAVSGVKTDIFTINFQSLYIVGIVVVFAFVIKLIAVMLPALCFSVPLREAFVLGLVLNARGIVELTVYNLWKDDQLMEDQEFTLVMMSVVIVTAAITPMIRTLYDPSKQYRSVTRSTIHNSKRDLEFRILVCIHNHENVPTIMNVLEASPANEESYIAVTAMVLIELVGRSTPVLAPSQPRMFRKNSSTADRVFNALSKYEERNEGYAYVQSYTSISHFQTMHNDICRIALEKRANIVIVPFHKQWGIHGQIEFTRRPIQNLNMNVLEKVPCSVGILVDRGMFVSVRTSRTKFRVAVLFIGGPDDMESLAYGCRMVKHQNVNLTVIHFLLFGGENSKERKHDTQLINEYRQANRGNESFVYVEEVFRDGEGLFSYISGTLNNYHLILVGRYHPNSPLLEGLGDWSECPELGIVGDMLASPDLKTKATVLVIQQQRIGGKLLTQNLPISVP
ncbi:cation/H(+) antiporter 15-like [Durio zibethinus]|uniref:Cation/H(+) antiporter 15-like n=1 Tax=Durio zibethinus TaxID=66656 RepID=A0A6P6AHU6_DURZI|nr:cation/H(+) antiporter 15-like [Durio zibethinus]